VNRFLSIIFWGGGGEFSRNGLAQRASTLQNLSPPWLQFILMLLYDCHTVQTSLYLSLWPKSYNLVWYLISIFISRWRSRERWSTTYAQQFRRLFELQVFFVFFRSVKTKTEQHSASESRGTQGRQSSTVCSRGDQQVYSIGGCTEW